uniref:Uncharacterized protein n=1 Tax=Arundo donax TaxID=35708 RepID=A0A0A9CA54_ARUDO
MVYPALPCCLTSIAIGNIVVGTLEIILKQFLYQLLYRIHHHYGENMTK